MTILELREKRAKAWDAAKAFLDSHRTDKGTLSTEDDATYGKKDAKYCSVECYGKARARAYEASRQKLKADAVSCGTVLQDLPTGCVCASCRWFVDGKRSCPCKKKAEKDV